MYATKIEPLMTLPDATAIRLNRMNTRGIYLSYNRLARIGGSRGLISHETVVSLVLRDRFPVYVSHPDMRHKSAHHRLCCIIQQWTHELQSVYSHC